MVSFSDLAGDCRWWHCRAAIAVLPRAPRAPDGAAQAAGQDLRRRARRPRRPRQRAHSASAHRRARRWFVPNRRPCRWGTGRTARHRRRARPQVERGAGDGPGHRRGPVQQELQAVLPIASITKLMTALVVTEAGLPLDEVLTVTPGRRATPKRAAARACASAPSSPAREMLHLALMSSENRAAHAARAHLSRRHVDAFVAAMNDKAQSLGMVRHALRRAHRAVEREPVERARPGHAGRTRRTSTRCIRELSTSPEASGGGRAARAAVPQHQRPGAQPRRGTSACRRPATSPRPVAAW